MEMYSGSGGLAESSVTTHYYGGATSTPKRKQSCKGGSKGMACKSKKGSKSRGKGKK